MKKLKAGKGQVMALGAVTMLVLALMLVLSFTLTRAIHEKIRLQSHSDAMAYSMATVQARAMNFYAYSNRATAASAVSIMTLHAYHAAMTMTANAMQAGMWNFIEIVGWEMASFASTCPSCQWDDLAHAIEAGIIAARFSREANRYNRALQGLEARFNFAVRLYSMLIDFVWTTQQSVTLHTLNVLRGNGLDSLHDINAPCSSQLPLGVAALNVREFACALEGSPIDFMCIAGRRPSSLRARSRVISNVANAARGDFPKNRNIPFPMLMHPRVLQDLMTGIQRQGFTVPVVFGGGGKVIPGTTRAQCDGNQANGTGETICGTENGLLTSFFRDTPPGFFPFSGEVYSNNNGGAHRPTGGHTGRHGEWRGFARIDNPIGCLTTGECFVNFRSDPRRNEDFGQARVYGVFQQSLRDMQNCNRGPWEIGQDGKLIFSDGARGSGVLDFVPRDPATGLSKAMVYFHRPDNWQMPPTAFDPYWKAKLHPFRNVEAATVLTAAGDLTGAAMAIGGPVDGRDP